MFAEEWLKEIKQLHKTKALPKEGVSREIVRLQGREFANAVQNSFTGVEWNSPDFHLRESLKRNVWKFSAAKNYNDLVRLNNLLLDEEGKPRSWSNFKREAKAVIGDSVRYLETEHRTITIASQMANKWQEIQRDKAIFPFVEFIVVRDKHTSEICFPLHGVVMSVDNPLLKEYFPPNHFNCRTGIKRLRRGKETQNILLPNIPKDFRNNSGISGLAFTEDNKYFQNADEGVYEKALRWLKNKEVSEWAKENISQAGKHIPLENTETGNVIILRKNVRGIAEHLADLELKDFGKNIEQICEKMEYLETQTLDKSKANAAAKIARGVSHYNYYIFEYKKQWFRVNVEVIKGAEYPYSINPIRKAK